MSDSSSKSPSYEPKAHIGWASFGELLKQSSDKSTEESVPPKRKVLVIRSKTPKAKQEVSDSLAPSDETPLTDSATVESGSLKPQKEETGSESGDEDEDEIVDVVGFDEEETKKTAYPPDLPPQCPLNTRFESHRQRKDLSTRRFDSDEEELIRRKIARTMSPPPLLERENNTNNNPPAPPVAVEKKGEVMKPTDLSVKDLEKRFQFCKDLDPSQMLKTKISSSSIPVLPLSKSIMEHHKAAIEMTKQAVIRRVPVPKSNTKSLSVAPKSVRVPAYSEKTSITLYSKVHKPSPPPCPKESRDCIRCRDTPAVDMSNFKFHDDSSVVAVRAHMCDQTRVMIARTALFNREYAKRLGENALGTMWQRPDEVTAQMTGFCSATVRRCIDIANMAIMPKCADRVGVSKTGLQSLQTAFGDEKFCGQTMKIPAILNTYYPMHGRLTPIERQTFPKKPSKSWEEKNAELMRMEEARKHRPLVPGEQPAASGSSTSAPNPLKKAVLRWTNVSSPRILRHPSTRPTSQPMPRTAVVPVIKTEKEKASVSETTAPTLRKRGRPRKEKPDEGDKPYVRPYTRRLRSNRRAVRSVVDQDVRDTIEDMIRTIASRF